MLCSVDETSLQSQRWTSDHSPNVQLKTKNINVLTGKLFCRQCKAKFWWEKDSVYHDKDKFQPVTVIDNGESEWLGYVAQGNAWKIENSIIFRTNPNSYLRTW